MRKGDFTIFQDGISRGGPMKENCDDLKEGSYYMYLEDYN